MEAFPGQQQPGSLSRLGEVGSAGLGASTLDAVLPLASVLAPDAVPVSVALSVLAVVLSPFVVPLGSGTSAANSLPATMLERLEAEGMLLGGTGMRPVVVDGYLRRS